MLLTRKFERFQLSEFGKLRFDWLMKELYFNKIDVQLNNDVYAIFLLKKAQLFLQYRTDGVIHWCGPCCCNKYFFNNLNPYKCSCNVVSQLRKKLTLLDLIFQNEKKNNIFKC